MATSELASVDSPSWLNDWWWPFAWITLTPIVTVPLSAILFSTLAGYHSPGEAGLPDRSEHGWFGSTHEYAEVLPTLIAFVLPGLLNLVSFLWVSSTRPRVRAAGIVAGLLGIVRVSIPVIVLMLSFDRYANASGTSYFDFVTEGFMVFAPAPHLELWFFGALAWLGTLLVWALFAVILCISEWRTGTTDPGKEGV